MDIYELINTLEQRKKGMAYQLWKQAVLNCYVLDPKEMPESPEKACPELYPTPKKYKMFDFLKNRNGKGEIKNAK